MHTPRGVFEFKYFFSSHLSSDHGEDQSSTSVRAKIRKLIGAENPKKPLSDSKIAKLLAEDGIKVARRTVAKYREAMNISSSSDRRERPAR
jgi:RNA polymerase sigma-54 factor